MPCLVGSPDAYRDRDTGSHEFSHNVEKRNVSGKKTISSLSTSTTNDYFQLSYQSVVCVQCRSVVGWKCLYPELVARIRTKPPKREHSNVSPSHTDCACTRCAIDCPYPVRARSLSSQCSSPYIKSWVQFSLLFACSRRRRRWARCCSLNSPTGK